ncbi:MAG: DUF5662 family protein [Lachnospiraceae bacterium]|nr:DUF5662 family protein [Lachnospiraceae bacterium]
MQLRNHLKTIHHHKMEVMKNCFRVKMYGQGLLHDLSKYHPVELIPGGKYFQGDRSPNAAEREEKGYSAAWLHHKGHNKHHWEYWIDFSPTERRMAGAPMPTRYVLEMVCDRIAASKTYKKEAYTDASPLEYYEKSRPYYMIHPETDRLLRELLTMLAQEGEEKTFARMRRLLGESRREALRKRLPDCVNAKLDKVWIKR